MKALMPSSNVLRLPLALCFVIGALFSQPQAATTFAPITEGLVLADVERSGFHSRFTGQDYNVYVLLPGSYRQSDRRYPVLYVPDIDEAFLLARGSIFWMGLDRYLGTGDVLEEFIVVGVPLRCDDPDDWARRRFFDLTPTEDKEVNASLGKRLHGEVRTGGAPLFLRTLKEELIPYIGSSYRTTPERGLAGHSLGGLFAAYAWLNDDNTFSRYLISSPSLWWNDGELLKSEASIAESGKALHGRVFLSVGAREGRRMVSPIGDFAAAITKHAYPGLRLESYVFEGENHLSVVPEAFSRGLNFLYARSQPK